MEKECPQCGRRFKPGRIDQVYCNNLCRQRAYLERKKSFPLKIPIPERSHLQTGIKPITRQLFRPHFLLPVRPFNKEMYDVSLDIQEEKVGLLSEIKSWLAQVANAINNRSIEWLKELQISMDKEAAFKMYYEPEHNELFSPTAGLVTALKLSIGRFQQSPHEDNLKWRQLEQEFYSARRGCRI